MEREQAAQREWDGIYRLWCQELLSRGEAPGNMVDILPVYDPRLAANLQIPDSVSVHLEDRENRDITDLVLRATDDQVTAWVERKPDTPLFPSLFRKTPRHLFLENFAKLPANPEFAALLFLYAANYRDVITAGSHDPRDGAGRNHAYRFCRAVRAGLLRYARYDLYLGEPKVRQLLDLLALRPESPSTRPRILLAEESHSAMIRRSLDAIGNQRPVAYHLVPDPDMLRPFSPDASNPLSSRLRDAHSAALGLKRESMVRYCPTRQRGAQGRRSRETARNQRFNALTPNYADWSTITREELNHLVWRLPLQGIAVKLGLSAGHILDRCERLGVARPLPGYWRFIGGRDIAMVPPAPQQPCSLEADEPRLVDEPQMSRERENPMERISRPGTLSLKGDGAMGKDMRWGEIRKVVRDIMTPPAMAVKETTPDVTSLKPVKGKRPLIDPFKMESAQLRELVWKLPPQQVVSACNRISYGRILDLCERRGIEPPPIGYFRGQSERVSRQS